jgi:hypothetical protein
MAQRRTAQALGCGNPKAQVRFQPAPTGVDQEVAEMSAALSRWPMCPAICRSAQGHNAAGNLGF